MLFRTKRLYLRNLQPEDIEGIFAYRNDPACAQYQRWEDTSREAILRYIDTFRACRFLSEQEEQHYAICFPDGVLAGELSYFYTERDCCVTLGITVTPEHQRKGIAREMLKEVIAEVRKGYPHLDIIALIDPENEASIRLFEALGFYRECYAQSICSYVYVIDGIR